MDTHIVENLTMYLLLAMKEEDYVMILISTYGENGRVGKEKYRKLVERGKP